MATFTYATEDADKLTGIAAARAAYNAGNPQNVQANDQAFFSLMSDSQAAQWAAQYNALTRTITISQAQALQEVLSKAAAAGVEGAAEMVQTAGAIIGG